MSALTSALTVWHSDSVPEGFFFLEKVDYDIYVFFLWQNEPWHDISNSVVCATKKASEQPAHTRCLIRAFASRLNILSVKLLTEHNLECLSLKGGCTGSSESTLVKMPHCWNLHVTAHLYVLINALLFRGCYVYVCRYYNGKGKLTLYVSLAARMEVM